MPSIEFEDDMDDLRASIKEIETNIIKEFGEEVIKLIEEKPNDEERYFIWADTDILFITNKRDGLYMSQLEYMIIRNALGKAKKSSVLISEFVGGANLLAGAYKFNPYNIKEMVKCLEKAVSYDTPQEKELKFKSMIEHVDSNTVEKWAYRFLRDIKYVHQKKLMLGHEGKQILANKLLIQKKKELLSSRDFLKNYHNSKSRLIIVLLDKIIEMLNEKGYYGSNPSESDSEETSDTEISQEILALLNKLSKDKKNKIWVISSEGRDKVMSCFQKLNDLGLAAEDGYFYRWHSQSGKSATEWTTLLKDND